MKVPVAFLADEANISQEGKLNVLGIFDRIAAPEFPVVHPRMVFVFRVQSEFQDIGRVFPVQVRLMDDQDQVMFEASGEISGPPVPPGDFVTANQVFTLVGVQFPHPGTYRFIVEVGTLEPHVAPFVLTATVPESELN